jgi:ABC-type dipeptide/oligopeptide/nickel transport system ATPase component
MLLEAVPLPDPVRQRERADQRRVYNPAASTGATAPVAQQGCPFQHRCPLVHEQCRVSMPPTMPVQGGGTVRCYAADDS